MNLTIMLFMAGIGMMEFAVMWAIFAIPGFFLFRMILRKRFKMDSGATTAVSLLLGLALSPILLGLIVWLLMWIFQTFGL